MADAAVNAGVDLGRLRRNAEENLPIFCTAGLQEHQILTVHCRECGAAERAIFWNRVSRSEGAIVLQCPLCQQWQVSYDLKRNEWRKPSFWRPARVAAALVGAGAVLYLGFREPVNRRVLEAWRTVESRVGSQAVDAVPDAFLPDTLPTRR